MSRARPAASPRCSSISNSSTEPATAAFSEPIEPRIGIRTVQVDSASDGRPDPLTLAPDDQRDRPSQVGLTSGQGRLLVGPDDPDAAHVQVGQQAGQVVDRNKQEVLRRACRGLDRGRRQRRLVVRREEDPVGPDALCAAQERADVLGILKRIEDQQERRLTAFTRPGEDVIDRGPRAGPNDECDSLVAVEAGDGGQCAAFDLDDRDSQARRVQDDPLKGLPALGNDEQSHRRPARNEGLLDGPAACDQLLVRPDKIRRRGGRPRRREGPECAGAARRARAHGSGGIAPSVIKCRPARRPRGIGSPRPTFERRSRTGSLAFAVGAIGGAVGRRCAAPLKAGVGPSGDEWPPLRCKPRPAPGAGVAARPGVPSTGIGGRKRPRMPRGTARAALRPARRTPSVAPIEATGPAVVAGSGAERAASRAVAAGSSIAIRAFVPTPTGCSFWLTEPEATPRIRAIVIRPRTCRPLVTRRAAIPAACPRGTSAASGSAGTRRATTESRTTPRARLESTAGPPAGSAPTCPSVAAGPAPAGSAAAASSAAGPAAGLSVVA